MRARNLVKPLIAITAAAGAGVFAILCLARIDVAVSGRGVMRPARYAELRASHAGRVVEILRMNNDQVAEGEAILVQDSTQELFALRTVERDIEKYEADLKACLGQARRERENRVARMETEVKACEAEIARREHEVEAARIALREVLENPVQARLSAARERIRQQEIRLAVAKKEVEDARELFERGMQSKATFEKLLSARQIAESELKVREEELRVLEAEARGLDAEKARKNLDAALSIVATLKATLEGRKKDLEKARLDLENDDAERDIRARLEKARIERDRLKKIIEEKTLRAPISGILADFHVKPSAVISSSDRLGWIYDISGLKFYASVRQTDMPRVRPGQKVELYLDALPYRKEGVFEAVVAEVSAVADRPREEMAAAGIDPSTPQGLVICRVLPCEKSGFFRVGFTGLAEVIVGRASIFSILAGWEETGMYGLDAVLGARGAAKAEKAPDAGSAGERHPDVEPPQDAARQERLSRQEQGREPETRPAKEQIAK
ncbi:MAG: HlyD family secretion protein [Planctomycetota bacterium]|nr:HlyD family secretion protein [Planctomycetota bacterium]